MIISMWKWSRFRTWSLEHLRTWSFPCGNDQSTRFPHDRPHDRPPRPHDHWSSSVCTHGKQTQNNCVFVVSEHAHREIFSKSYHIKTKSDLITIFLDWFGTANGQPSAVPNQSENGKYNLILDWFDKISKRFLCVQISSGVQPFKRLPISGDP